MEFVLIGVAIIAAGAVVTVLLAHFMTRRESWVFDRPSGEARHVWQSHLARRETVIALSRITGCEAVRTSRDAQTREPRMKPRLVLEDGSSRNLISHAHAGPMPQRVSAVVSAWLPGAPPAA